VHEGDVVTVTFKNEGRMMHDWVVEGENIATKTINGGQADVIQFVAPKKGSYETFCSVGTHRKMGMVGKLIVQ
ncbi:cupredoxin domain-containing protein, partial [Candidatus Woesebacteria bacterium]|nr:cupredoxin domain-containing protein [Candidatus Woesebacteria bacterium]